MKIEVLDKTGKKVEELTLDKSVFGIKPNLVVLAQYVRVFLHNQRQGTSSTKTRAEVSGSGKKPWRQKGSGRARVGSKRIPLWRHGGISHGPKPKSWNLTLPKKIKKLALISALSSKAVDKKISVVNELKMTSPKTSDLATILKALDIEKTKTLLVLDQNNLIVRKSAQNLKNVKTSLHENLNAFDVLNAEKVLFVKDAILRVQDKYANK